MCEGQHVCLAAHIRPSPSSPFNRTITPCLENSSGLTWTSEVRPRFWTSIAWTAPFHFLPSLMQRGPLSMGVLWRIRGSVNQKQLSTYKKEGGGGCWRSLQHQPEILPSKAPAGSWSEAHGCLPYFTYAHGHLWGGDVLCVNCPAAGWIMAGHQATVGANLKIRILLWFAMP